MNYKSGLSGKQPVTVPTYCVAKSKQGSSERFPAPYFHSTHSSTSHPRRNHQHLRMTLSPSAALSILIPINIENKDIAPGSPDSVCSADIQSDDENDREVAEKRLSRYFPETPVSVGAIIKPQFSCPDFAMGTARGMKGRMKEAPPAVPSIPAIHVRKTEDAVETSPTGDHTSPSPRQRVRPMNSFVQLDSVKRGWKDSFDEQKLAPRKRHGIFMGRLQR